MGLGINAHFFQQCHGQINCIFFGFFHHMDRRFNDIFQNGHMAPEIEMLKHHSQTGPNPVNLFVVFRNRFPATVFFHANQLA